MSLSSGLEYERLLIHGVAESRPVVVVVVLLLVVVVVVFGATVVVLVLTAELREFLEIFEHSGSNHSL